MSMRKPTRLIALAAIAGAALMVSAAVLAQNATGPRPPNARMRVAQPGGNSAMSRRAYVPGMSTQPKPLYVVTRGGDMVYAPNNAFSPRSSYTALGVHQQGNQYSAASMKRFRGYGTGAGFVNN